MRHIFIGKARSDQEERCDSEAAFPHEHIRPKVYPNQGEDIRKSRVLKGTIYQQPTFSMKEFIQSTAHTQSKVKRNQHNSSKCFHCQAARESWLISWLYCGEFVPCSCTAQYIAWTAHEILKVLYVGFIGIDLPLPMVLDYCRKHGAASCWTPLKRTHSLCRRVRLKKEKHNNSYLHKWKHSATRSP